MSVRFDSGLFSVINTNSSIAVGATLAFYASGTSTPLATYSDSALTTLNPNPVTLNADGRIPPIFLQNALYKVVLSGGGLSGPITLDPIDGGTLAGSNGAGDVGYSVTSSYAAGTLGKHEQGFISVTDAPFNAKADGTTDDTAAVQAAIDYANTFADAPAIFIPGKCVVTALTVNRRVDTKTGYLRFVGVGPGAGFKINAPGTIFNSTLTGVPTGSPQSEKVAFECIQFEAANAADACYALSKNFLRIRFDNCIFRKIKMGLFQKGSDASAYAQQFIIRGGHATGWTGDFLNTFQSYSLNVNGFQMEAGGGGFSHPGGAFNATIVQSMFEGCTGTFLFTAGANQVTLIGNYTEGNGAPDYILTDVPNGGATRGVTFQGNFMQVASSHGSDPNFWNVIVGDTRGMISGGNYCSYQFFDDSVTTYGNLISVGDNSVNGLNKSGKSITVLPSAADTAKNLIVLAGSNAATATPITNKLNRITSGTGGVVLPTADYGAIGGEITIVNYGPNTATVYGKGSDTINSVASVPILSGATRVFTCTAGGIWNSTITSAAPQADSAAGTVAALVTDFNALLAKLRAANVIGT